MAAGLVVLVSILCVFVSCNGNNFGFGPRQIFQQRVAERQRDFLLRKLANVNSEDQKCFTLARRPIYTTRLMQYPCQNRMNGVTIVKSYMSPIGPMCMSYFREPVYRYYKIQTCCPGYTKDSQGKCSVPTFRKLHKCKHHTGIGQPQVSLGKGQPPYDMMAMAARMRQHMWLKAQKEMAKRREMMLMQMNQMQRPRQPEVRPPMMQQMPPQMMMQQMRSHMLMKQMHSNMMQQMHSQMMPRVQPQMDFQMRRPMMPPRRPVSKLLHFYTISKLRNGPKIAYLRFGNIQPQESPRVQRTNSLGQRVIKLLRNSNTAPVPPMMANRMTAMPNIGNQMQQTPNMNIRQPQGFVLSNRSPALPASKLQEFHPFDHASSMQRIEPSSLGEVAHQEGHVEEPSAGEEYVQDGFQQSVFGYPQFDSQDGFSSPQQEQENLLQVDLPSQPLEMPSTIVGKVPEVNCIVALETAVKSCLKQNNIEVPDVMSAFEPFNDDTSRFLCEAEDVIFKCIWDSIEGCNETEDASIARDMLHETAETVRSMCELRAASVADNKSIPEAPAQPEDVPNETAVDTSSTVENVDAILARENEQITVEDTKPDVSAESVQQAIQNEVHVQELRMKEFLLPVLLGAGVGFMILVLVISLLLCCCCRRRMRKKMTMAREIEKPPIKDEIYTIGVAPPTYETQGIPPMYYEEAKGEKISSKSSVEGQQQEEKDA